MPRLAIAGGLELDFQRQGGDGPPLVLIMGLGAQRTVWPPELLDGLAEEGFGVITLDNRDVGLSAGFDHAGVVDQGTLMGALSGQIEVTPPYSLQDMADDSVALLNHLGLDSAHIVGASMGGMIAQHVAFGHPERVRSLVSIMSTTGAAAIGRPTPEAAQALLVPAPADRESYIEHSVRIGRVVGSRSLFDGELEAERAAASFDRAYRPQAAGRQLLAVIADGDRTERLAGVRAPTLVVHGADDPLIQPDGGEATATAIKGARFELVDEMGHDFPRPLIPRLVELITNHARAAEGDDPATRR